MPPCIRGDNPKRQRSEPEENEEMQCLICLDLAVDAVQVSCCGALHCRACILHCTVCPQCRKTIPSVVPDVRRERLSAAALRRCSQEENGCQFQGNRASVASHEDICDFVPRAVLRARMLKAESQHVASIQRIKEFMTCALNPDPAATALRLLYSTCANMGVFEISRAESRGRSHWVCSWFKSQGVQYQQQQRPQQYPHRMEQCVDLIRRTMMVTPSDATFHHACAHFVVFQLVFASPSMHNKYFLQDPENNENLHLSVLANDDRCFTCGAKGHWQSMCTTQKSATVNELLFKAECCSNCGIPMKAVDGTPLHAGVAGKHCMFPRHFLEVGWRCNCRRRCS